MTRLLSRARTKEKSRRNDTGIPARVNVCILDVQVACLTFYECRQVGSCASLINVRPRARGTEVKRTNRLTGRGRRDGCSSNLRILYWFCTVAIDCNTFKTWPTNDTLGSFVSDRFSLVLISLSSLLLTIA